MVDIFSPISHLSTLCGMARATCPRRGAGPFVINIDIQDVINKCITLLSFFEFLWYRGYNIFNFFSTKILKLTQDHFVVAFEKNGAHTVSTIGRFLIIRNKKFKRIPYLHVLGYSRYQNERKILKI